FRQVTRVLQRVGEVELVHAVEELRSPKLVHVDRDARLVIDVAKAAGRPLEVNANITGDKFIALLERRLDVFPRLAAQRVEFLRPQLERHAQYLVTLEKLVARLLRLLVDRPGGEHRPAQADNEQQKT